MGSRCDRAENLGRTARNAIKAAQFDGGPAFFREAPAKQTPAYLSTIRRRRSGRAPAAARRHAVSDQWRQRGQEARPEMKTGSLSNGNEKLFIESAPCTSSGTKDTLNERFICGRVHQSDALAVGNFSN